MLAAVLAALATVLGASGGWRPSAPEVRGEPEASESLGSPAARAGADTEIPPPRPLSTHPYEVGAYYFPGWASYDRWRVLDRFPERVPLLGYYQEGDPTVMDWQIKWALEHGVSFFVFDWYWSRGQRPFEQALQGGYLRARFRPLMKFALLWANHNPPGSASEADLLAMLDHVIAHYLRRPEYFTIDGRPLLIIFSSTRLTRDLGSEGVRRALAAMRARARSRGLPGLFLVALTGATASLSLEERLRTQSVEGYDATTGYNYPRAGMAPGSQRETYATAVSGYREIWESIAAAGRLDYIPVTEPGWDARPWHGERALVRTERTPAAFRRMLENARRFADRHPLAGDRRLVLIEAWNEYGEGAAIEPHCEWGFGYLEAVRDVFGAGDPPRPQLTPAALGGPVPQVVRPPRPGPDPLHPCPPSRARPIVHE